MPSSNAKPAVSFEDRLENGSLTVPETLALAQVSRTKFYADVKAGLVSTFKRGRSTRIRGQSAKAYAAGNSSARAA